MNLKKKVLEGAAWKACSTHKGFDGLSALGDISGMFEESDVASHQCGSEEAEDLPEREVPGHHG
jgi:hypothetical protein